MQCVECSHLMITPALTIAMEQREHFALQRNAEACTDCARKLFGPVEQLAAKSRFWHQSMQCASCGATPIMRLRFEIEKCHAHVALCDNCYGKVRDELLRVVPNIIGFLEKEWQTGAAKVGKRLPWLVGCRVKVKSHVPRFHGQMGHVTSFRGLLQPWYGYEVKFDGSGHHFFHERDLDVLAVPEPVRHQTTHAHEAQCASETTTATVSSIAEKSDVKRYERKRPQNNGSLPEPDTARSTVHVEEPEHAHSIRIGNVELEPVDTEGLPMPGFPLP